jgi:hypothetical protein
VKIATAHLKVNFLQNILQKKMLKSQDVFPGTSKERAHTAFISFLIFYKHVSSDLIMAY